jgi:RNA polymerase sigma-70 factor, ECF subfamily
MAQRNLREAVTVEGRAPLDLTRIYREHAAEVSRWAQRLGGPHAHIDVDDVLSEVFLVAHRRLREFRGDAKITTWLYAITLNVVRDMRRRERWRRWLRFGRAETEPAAGLTPLQELEGRHAAALTYQLLDRLPEAERSALILFEMEGLSGEQIAALTGEAVGTVWVRLHRARARFRKHFLEHERRSRGKGAAS